MSEIRFPIDADILEVSPSVAVDPSASALRKVRAQKRAQLQKRLEIKRHEKIHATRVVGFQLPSSLYEMVSKETAESSLVTDAWYQGVVTNVMQVGIIHWRGDEEVYIPHAHTGFCDSHVLMAGLTSEYGVFPKQLVAPDPIAEEKLRRRKLSVLSDRNYLGLRMLAFLKDKSRAKLSALSLGLRRSPNAIAVTASRLALDGLIDVSGDAYCLTAKGDDLVTGISVNRMPSRPKP